MKAGDYTSRLRLLVGTRTRDTDTGQDVLTHAAAGYLWCAVNETNGRNGTEYGGRQTGVDGEIRVRNYPTVTVDDILHDESYDYYWRIDSMRVGNNQLLLDVHRFDEVIDFTLEDSDS